tara:strand:- start:62 stop:1060 length:999 start_codon:yes stop_codon:yes gene_type:complete
MLENECLKRIDFEDYPMVNVDDHSTPEEIIYGKNVCKNNNVKFILNEGRGVQFSTNTAIKYFKNHYDCEWVFCFQHDVWPLTDKFFTKFDDYVRTKNVNDIGAIGFNVLDNFKEYSGNGYYEFLNGKKPKGWLGIMNLCDNRPIWKKLNNKELIIRYKNILIGNEVPLNNEINRRFFCPKVTKNFNRISKMYNGLFSVELPAWVCVAINVEKWFKYISPTDDFIFHLWFNDVAYQFMKNNIYVAVTSDLYVENEQRIKLKYGMSKSSAHEILKKGTKFMQEDGDHLKVFNLKWGWSYEDSKSTYPAVREKYAGTLIDKLFYHDFTKGPYRTF